MRSPPPLEALPKRADALPTLVRWLAPLAALLLVTLYFTWRTGGLFLRGENLTDIGQQAAIIVIVGVGQTLVIISGGIDLSVGAVMAFTGTLAAALMLRGELAPAVAATVGTAAGGLVGLFNGFVTVRARLHPFIITLGSMMMIRGLALALTGAQNTDLLPDAFTRLGRGDLAIPLGGARELVVAPVLVTYLVAIALAAHLFLTRTRAGRYCFAIGSNAQAARLSGIRVGACVTLYFVLAGLLFGFAGVVQAARLGIGTPNGSQNLELESIAAAVIGGTSLSGGQGTIGGTVLGALLMAALRVGFRMENYAPHWQTFWLGAAIILAVVYDRASRRRTA